MVKWTEEQAEAIYYQGSDILVSAAAGSGKTAVLVERIIQKVINKENPLNIDEILVATFTNAAAAEMRKRIGDTLEKALADDPTSQHLKKQVSLLQHASISTLHSFCMKVVRENAYLIDLDPEFSLTDDIEATLIKEDVLDEMFEDWYGKETAEREAFFSVVDRFSNDRNDLELGELIINLYTFAVQNPWPEKWLNEVANNYHIPKDWQEEDLTWLRLLKNDLKEELSSMLAGTKAAMDIINTSDGPYHYAEAIQADQLLIQEALDKLQVWDDLQSFMKTSKFKRLSGKRVECDEEKKEAVKQIRKVYQDSWKKMKDEWFARSLTSHISDMQKMYPIIQMVVQLVLEFKERFTRAKQAKTVIDFSDLEHYSLSILKHENSTPEDIKPSRIALEYQAKFEEVLIDEYQDINHVQETILSLLSKSSKQGNRFMVGDVKQSIYRFRHADPTLFIDKYKTYSNHPELGKKIDLAKNFRSRSDVLTATNYIFRQILDEAVGEITYDQTAELIYANDSYDDVPLLDAQTELILIDRDEQGYQEDEEQANLEKAQTEGRAYAKKIKEWLGTEDKEPLQVIDPDTNQQRDVQYRDIVILQRSKTDVPVIVEELKKQGIPVYGELKTGYFAAIEIQVMINMLRIIDNPYQDIPLASVLHSPIVGLNEEQLANIRLVNPKSSYYEALIEYKKINQDDITDKIERFLDQITLFKNIAKEGELSELIWRIYGETAYYDFVGGIPGGKQRQANLRALYDRAKGYEQSSYRGLFRFLRFIERMKELDKDLGTAPALSEQEDVVRIISIHQSKGLEFPVVILGNINKNFNFTDLWKKYLLDKDLGFASKYIDPEKRITYATLYYRALQTEVKRKLLAEEMRVLYVAMTRAKEKLVMIGNVNSLEKTVENWHNVIEHEEWILPTDERKSAKSYLDWIGKSIVRHADTEILRMTSEAEPLNADIIKDESSWKIEVMHASELQQEIKEHTETKSEITKAIQSWKPVEIENEYLTEEVDKRLNYVYPYQEAINTRAKQSVTEIKRQQEVEDIYGSREVLKPYRSPITQRPLFMQEEKELTSAEKGTAMHAVMQYLPFNKPLTQKEIKMYIEEMINKKLILAEAAKTINIAAIERFFTTELAYKMMQSTILKKEIPFMFSENASKIYQDWQNKTDEKVVIQGIIDCLFYYEDNWYIVDYKTDRIVDEVVTEKTVDQLKHRYETQIGLYQRAIESILKTKVTKTYLYFFDKELII